MKRFFLRVLSPLAAAFMALLILGGPLHGAVAENPGVGVAVKIYARGQGAGGSISLSGTFLPSLPGGNDSYAAASGSATGSDNYATAVLGAQGVVRLEPGKSYTVSAGGSITSNRELNVVAPAGYRVMMDGMIRSRETYDGVANIVIQIQSATMRHPGLAGLASAVAANDVDWQLSLGPLHNGGSAGSLALIDTGNGSDWSALFTPSALYYETTSEEISVYRPSNIIRQIVANQVVVDVVTINGTSYEIRCYNPAQASSFPATLTGSPFVTYRIEQGATPTTIKFTKEVRNVTDSSTTFPVARREFMTLSRTGTWPDVTWTRSEWTLEGAAPLTETVVVSTGDFPERTETIGVHVPSPTAEALTVERTFAVRTGIGEVLTSETVGSTNGLTTDFYYYSDVTKFGSFSYLKYVKTPGGGWVGYEYHDADVASGFRGGRVKNRYKPFLNSPAASSAPDDVVFDPDSGEVAHYEYVNDVFGAPNRPSLVETRVNGILTAKETTTYVDDSLETATKLQYSSSGQTLKSIVRSFPRNSWDGFTRGQPYTTTAPDGVKQEFVYQLGSWDGSLFTDGAGEGTASRISVITGSSNTAAGTSLNYYAGYIETIYLIDGKSTLEVTTRDSRALVVRTESYVWKSAAWQLVGYTNLSYDYAGRLTGRVASNGATYGASYDGGLKISETDEAGVVTDFTYDAAGRLSVKIREGSGTIAALPASYTFDGAGRVITETVGYSGSETIVTATAYDDAGRVTTETPPGSIGVLTHTYNVSDRTHTVTKADSSTTITTTYADGRLKSITGTGTVPTYLDYGAETDGRLWKKQYAGTSNSARWSEDWTDWIGREVRTEKPGFTSQPNSVTENFYDTVSYPTVASVAGHLVKTTKTGYAPTLYEYNHLGQVSRSGLDYDNNGRLELASGDRIAEEETYLEPYLGAWWSRKESRTYSRLGSGVATLVSVTRTRLTGHGSNILAETQVADVEGNLTTSYATVNRSARTGAVATMKSGISGTRTESTVNGLPTTVVDFDGLVSATEYDALLRPSVSEDSRGNRTTTAYVSGTKLVLTVTNAAGNQTATSYDSKGRVAWTRDPRNYYTRFEYNTRDQVTKQWGDGAMPVSYGYDSTYGDKTGMSTYRSGTGWTGSTWPVSPGTADTTTWAYHEATGLLASKTDAVSKAVTQTYNERGQTAVRTLARQVSGSALTTTYSYDSATGELLNENYSDSTPDVTFTYGRTGQVETVADGTGTRDLVYDPAKPWRLTAEAMDTFYSSRVISRLYDESNVKGRVRGFQVGNAAGSNGDLEETFGFTNVGRFETLTSSREGNGASRTFRYAYEPNSRMLKSLAIDANGGVGGHPFTISRTYESTRDLVTSIEGKWSTTSRTKYAYTYDERGQRTTAVQTGDEFADFGGTDNGATFRLFTYNGRGEMEQEIAYLGATTSDQSKPLNGRRHEFSYDNAGNRAWSNRSGNSTLRDDYTTNALNQYTQRENNTLPVSGTAAVDGGGSGGTAVVVQTGLTTPITTGRQGKYWNDEIVVSNSTGPWRGPVTIYTAKRGTPDLFRIDSPIAQIAAALQSFTYDDDGNLTSDGITDYQWDAENRLIRMETTSNARSLGFPHRILEFKYDYMGRRVQKRVLDGAPNPDVEISCHRYLYDGWNLIAEYDATGGSSIGRLLRSYTWGLDIVNSQTDAGGVGALLQIADHPSGQTYLPTYDGNGNIAALINAVSGSLAAAYEFSAYGEALRAQSFDSIIADNPFRFSTKYTDLETGLVYYGHRYYDPKNGRFINRDPIEESGGLHLYAFCLSDPINKWDVLGNWPTPYHQRALAQSMRDAGFSPNEIGAARSANRQVDSGPGGQSVEADHTHFMRMPGDTQAKTLGDIDTYARELISNARQAREDGNEPYYMDAIGQLSHLLQDATSPAHVDQTTGVVKVWAGADDVVHLPGAAAHVLREAIPTREERIRLRSATDFAVALASGEAALDKTNVAVQLFRTIGNETAAKAIEERLAAERQTTVQFGTAGGNWPEPEDTGIVVPDIDVDDHSGVAALDM